MSQTEHETVLATEDLAALTAWFDTSGDKEPNALSILTGITMAYHMGYRRALEDMVIHPRRASREVARMIQNIPAIQDIPTLDDEAAAVFLQELFDL